MASPKLQFCWAHLIREIKFLAENADKKTANYGKRLLRYIREMFSTIHRRDKLSPRYRQRLMREHQRALMKTSQRSIPDNNDANLVCQRLYDWQSDYFRLIGAGIPPTNNLAEQSIRGVTIDRRITQGTRSDRGSRWQERFWSILATCEQRGRNVMSLLCSCIASLLQGHAPPSLLRE